MTHRLFGRNTMPYRKKIYLRIIYSAAITVAGAIAFTLAILAQSSGVNMDDYTRGFYSGGGGGVFVAGAVMTIRYLLLLRNPERMRRAEIRENDERNIYIGQKVWSYSGYIFYIVLYIAVLVAGFFSKTVFITLTAMLGVLAGIMLIVKIVLNRNV